MASTSTEDKVYLAPADLAIGLYIDLELGWRDHPFTFSRFKIKSDKDIRIIKRLKLKRVAVYPKRSDVLLIETPATDCETQSEPVTAEDEAIEARQWEEKQQQLERSREFHRKRREIANKYNQASKQIRQVTADLRQRPANAIHDIDGIITQLAVTFEQGKDMLTQLVNLGNEDFSDFNHITNVTMLSLMLGSSLGLSGNDMKLLGTGALLHDIGKIEVPGGIRHKKTALTQSEQEILKRHTLYGRKLIERVKAMNVQVLDIIEQHHEYLDGSGYPKGLKGKQLSPLVRIVTITNLYDNLCNPADINAAVTPKVALATLYHHFKNKLDRSLVERLIGLLGVYPPGSVVKLNDETLGLVISAASGAALAPCVLVYDADIPKEQAQIINLQDFPELKIAEALNPGDFPPQIYQYLGVQDRLSYLAESMTM
jgi:putative nucleotidyltransferase with HDIG domain